MRRIISGDAQARHPDRLFQRSGPDGRALAPREQWCRLAMVTKA